MKKAYYFAFGSNLDSERIRLRIGHAPVYRTIKLHGYKLEFNCSSQRFANIIQSDNLEDFIEGVLYEVSDFQGSCLDRYEGFYDRFYLVNQDNIIFGYKSKGEFLRHLPGKPNLEYLNLIISGCWQHGLHETYSKLIDFKNANYKLKKKASKKNLNYKN